MCSASYRSIKKISKLINDRYQINVQQYLQRNFEFRHTSFLNIIVNTVNLVMLACVDILYKIVLQLTPRYFVPRAPLISEWKLFQTKSYTTLCTMYFRSRWQRKNSVMTLTQCHNKKNMMLMRRRCQQCGSSRRGNLIC